MQLPICGVTDVLFERERGWASFSPEAELRVSVKLVSALKDHGDSVDPASGPGTLIFLSSLNVPAEPELVHSL